MKQKRLNGFTYDILVNASQLAYVEEAHGTLALLEKYNALFRYLTREVETVTLYHEIEMVDKYIAIQKVRYGDRLTVTIRNDTSYKGNFIRHLSLLDFIDFVVCDMLEKCEGCIHFHLELETNKENLLKLTAETEGGTREFSRNL